MVRFQLSIVMVSLLLLQLLSLSLSSSTFTVINKCTFTVWPGLLSGAGTPPLSTTGFALQPGQSASVPVPTSWSGRLWARTLCTEDPTTNKFTCITGDCGSGSIECSGGGAAPPATLVEFTLNGAGGLDFFDISLVDGFNLPIVIAPQGGTGANCKITGCVSDLNKACPEELKVTEAGVNGSDHAVACKSACEAFGEPHYCCRGEFSTPDKCKPSSYSKLFKNACPQAYSYAYDDGTSTVTCEAATEYDITFCPEPEPDTSSSFNREIKMAANASAASHCITSGFIGSAVFVVAVTWGLSQLL